MCITSPAHIYKKTTTKKHSLSVLQLRWEFAWSSNSCVVFSGQWRSNPFVNIIRDFLGICSSFQSFLSIGEQTRFRVTYSHSYWIRKPSQIINFGSRVFFKDAVFYLSSEVKVSRVFPSQSHLVVREKKKILLQAKDLCHHQDVSSDAT